MEQEKTFMDSGGVKVTNARVIVNGDTYALANVTSCKARYHQNEGVHKGKALLKKLNIVLGIALGIFVGIRIENIILAIAIILAAIIGALSIKSKYKYRTYSIYFGSASGEKEAVNSANESFINEIVQAVNEAIVSRG